MDKHWKWPVISFIVGAGLGIGALAVQEADKKPPWVVPALFATAGLLLTIALVWALWDLGRWTASRLRALEWRWPLKRRSASATSDPDPRREKLLSIEIDQLKGDAEKREMELSALRDSVASASAEAREHFQIRAFGRTLRELPALDVTTQEAVRMQLAQIGPSLNTMYNEADAMWRHVGADAHVAGPNTAIHWLHGYVHGREYQEARNITQRFWEQLEAKRDLRPILTTFCLNYFAWRDKIVLLGDLSGQPVSRRDGYAAWHDAEMAFFGKLEDKVAIPEVDDVRQQIRAFFGVRGIVIKPAMPAAQLALAPPNKVTRAIQEQVEKQSERNTSTPPFPKDVS